MLGTNVKITAPASVRPQVRRMLETLGATLASPVPDMDVGVLGGCNLGFQFVADAAALTIEQMRLAPWLELEVPDVAAMTGALDALGLERLDYHDKAHPYFAAPGGVVFRLAPA